MEMLLTDEELLLRTDNQEANNAYVEELEKIVNFKKQVLDKKKQCKQNIAELEHQLAELNSEYILDETDPKQLGEIHKLKKSIRLEIEDYREIIDTEFMQVVQSKLDALKEMKQAALQEQINFNRELKNRKLEYLAFKKEIDANMLRLNAINTKHSYHRVNILEGWLKRG